MIIVYYWWRYRLCGTYVSNTELIVQPVDGKTLYKKKDPIHTPPSQNWVWESVGINRTAHVKRVGSKPRIWHLWTTKKDGTSLRWVDP